MATTNTSKVPIGTVLEGKFRLTREIGRGGMAAVYEAENVDIGKRVAVKILAAELITSRVVRERFIREARAAAAIRSPYICDVYDSGMYDDRPFLVMELLEGESLYDMMTRVRQLDVQTTVRIATHAARGLAKAHESNVVHRDLKPENIFLTEDEDGKLLGKILDFGLAKFYEQTGPDAVPVRLTREGALFGTPAYMSPEQAKGQGEVDHRADLWALGCIVYECLTGQTVWNVEQGVAMILAQIASSPLPRPSKLRPDLPQSFERWFERALERDPDARFQTAREFADSLSEAFQPKDAQRFIPTPVSNERIALDGPFEREPPGEPPLTVERSAISDSTPPAPPREPAELESVRPEKGSGLRAISWLLVIAAVALGGYATWLYVLHPPGKAAAPKNVESAAAARPKRPPKAAAKNDRPPENYAEKLAEAQALLVTEPKRALDVFKAAFDNGNMPAARSLLTQATVAIEEGGACRVTGLARPRPFELEVPVSRPLVLPTNKGVVVSWVDNHLDARRRQAFTVLLDSAMRRVSAPVAVTPEAHNVRQAQLVRTGDRLGLIFWDDGSKEPGVYTRVLDAEGKIESPTSRISSYRRGDHYPVILPSGEGEFLALWEEEFQPGASDLVLRRLGPDLKPKAPMLRLTGLFSSTGPNRQPRTPDATIAHGKLYVTFAKDLGPDRIQIMLQIIPLDDAGLEGGLVLKPVKAAAGKPRQKKKADEFLGVLKPVSNAEGRNAQPHVACADDGCFIAWDDEKGGSFVSFWHKDRGPLWHREFAPKGKRPMLRHDQRGVIMAYYEDSRVKLANLTRNGVGKASVVSRVNGFQPSPDIVAGEAPGQWYVAFRDYESAHLEVFALRAECP